MKRLWLVPILPLAIGGASAPKIEAPIFACSLGAKQVSVSALGDALVYRYGTPAKIELTIVGSVARGNVFARTERYANIENQLRFTQGRFSYVVFSVGAKPSVGARGVSGLTVLEGTRPIRELTCRRWTELDRSRYDHMRLPEDGAAYLAL